MNILQLKKFDISSIPQIPSSYKFDAIDQKLILDTIDWFNNGGDVFDVQNENAKLRNLTYDEVYALIHYKDIFNASTNSPYSKYAISGIHKAIADYGKTTDKLLYRGISKVEKTSIEKFLSNKIIGSLSRIKSFSDNMQHAKAFSELNLLMTVDSNNKKILDYDSFWISIMLAYVIDAENDPDDVFAEIDVENEWLIAPNTKFKCISAPNLEFKLI